MLVAFSDDASFLEVSSKAALKVATKDYSRGKQTMKIELFRLFFKKKGDQKNQSFSDKFGMPMAGSGTYFLKVSGHISLKVVTSNSFR